MQKWKIEITIEVADLWVADGFNMGERIAGLQSELAGDLLPFARPDEVKVKCKLLSAPSWDTLCKLQKGE